MRSRTLSIQIDSSKFLVRWRVGALVQLLKLPAWKVRDRGFKPRSGIQVSKKHHVSSPLTPMIQYWGNCRDRDVAWDRQGSNFESHFSLYVHKGDLKPHFFNFISFWWDELSRWYRSNCRGHTQGLKFELTAPTILIIDELTRKNCFGIPLWVEV